MKKEPKKIDLKEIINKRKMEKNNIKKKNIKKNKPIFRLHELVILIIVTSIISLFVGFLVTNKLYKTNNLSLYDENIKSLIENYNYLTENYYKDIDKEKIVDAAIEGMIGAIEDPYTNYIDEETSSTFNATLNGSYEGVGIEVANNDKKDIIVVKVFENSPAKEAGVQAGDIIKKYNDKSLENTKTSDFVALIKESKNATFNLTILRDNKEKIVTLKNTNITLESVLSKIITEKNKKIGYLNITIFANNTYSQLKEKLEELEKENIDGLIIDVRGNSGGHLTSVGQILSLFLDKTHIIYQLKDKEQIQKVYSTGKETKKYPITVLMNNNSASASEILAIALKEEYNATLVGMKTYGKNTVQELQTLPNGSQYKVTTKNWLSPKGILTEGIKPDIEIELDEKYIKNPVRENDNQLKKAIETFIK